MSTKREGFNHKGQKEHKEQEEAGCIGMQLELQGV
jgi:hypothetical protein